MKVLWIVLGILFGVCLLCGGGGFYLYSISKGAFDDAGRFGDTAFQAIGTSNWEPKTYMSYLDGSSFESRGEVEKWSEELRAALGPVKTFTSHLSQIAYSNGATTAVWSADVTFEKGKGTAQMNLIKNSKTWQIHSFDIESPELSEYRKQHASNEGETQPDEPPMSNSGEGTSPVTTSGAGGTGMVNR